MNNLGILGADCRNGLHRICDCADSSVQMLYARNLENSPPRHGFDGMERRIFASTLQSSKERAAIATVAALVSVVTDNQGAHVAIISRRPLGANKFGQELAHFR